MNNTTTAGNDLQAFDRRQFLAGSAAAGALSLAGCLALGSATTGQTFGHPQELIQMGGRERHLVFEDAGDPDVSFTLRQDILLAGTPDSQPEWIPFFLSMHHRKGLRTERMTLRIRAPAADGSGFDANVYLRSPETRTSPVFSLSRSSDGWTVLNGDELGKPPAGRSIAPGDANLNLNLLVNPLSSHPAEELLVEFDAELSEPTTIGRQSRTATGHLTFPFVRG